MQECDELVPSGFGGDETAAAAGCWSGGGRATNNDGTTKIDAMLATHQQLAPQKLAVRADVRGGKRNQNRHIELDSDVPADRATLHAHLDTHAASRCKKCKFVSMLQVEQRFINGLRSMDCWMRKRQQTDWQHCGGR
uniref:Uncharacterized protein n=1 Tax=Globodera pallida TaxID=36090 RepID=A0A183CHL1_GLOPA